MLDLHSLVAIAMGALPRPAAPLRALVDLERPFWWSMIGALLLGVWLLGRWLRRRRPEPEAVPVATATPRAPSAFRQRVESLREEIESSREYRRGCHALARHVREELRSRLPSHRSPLAMTATELAVRSADPRVDDLVLRLREVRFAREHPGRPQFHALCNDAVSALDREGP